MSSVMVMIMSRGPKPRPLFPHNPINPQSPMTHLRKLSRAGQHRSFLGTDWLMPVSTEIAAWWGAILATVVFVWDIIKWRLAGPRLRLTIRSGMKTANVPEYEGKTLLLAQVVNYGDRPTTITHLAFSYYRNAWNRLRK